MSPDSLANSTSLLIAGVDEAGRGPLAGPVVAAAVVMEPGNLPAGVRDSKTLSEKTRERLAQEIQVRAKAVGIGVVHEQEIDRTNILTATLKAMRQAVDNLDVAPQEVLIDGRHLIPELSLRQRAIVDGDASEPLIAAASIIAKVTRDAMLKSYDRLFPEYGFAAHKGYGTRAHLAALKEHGRCPIHRRSFKPVSSIPNLHYQRPTTQQDRGRMGEIFAAMHFIRQGYHLLHRGYHAGRDGEIDLIVERDDTVVFVEVKSGLNLTELSWRVDPRKQHQLVKLANRWLETHARPDRNYRFDLVLVDFSPRKPDLHHYADAFSPF